VAGPKTDPPPASSGASALRPASLESLAARIPVVMLGRHDESLVYDTVAGDDWAGARLAMSHLFELGHTRIAHLTRTEEATAPSLRSPHGVRLETYLATMEENGLGGSSRVARTGATDSDAYVTTLELLSGDDRPTAIFAGHDQLALGVLRAMAELGLTSADVSVVGYDDIEIAAHPGIALTTIDQFGFEMGGEAARMLIERIEGRVTARQYLFAPVLRRRASTQRVVPALELAPKRRSRPTP
jgi:LacI family transcriptional regulator